MRAASKRTMPGCIVCASSTDVASPCCKIHVCHECLRASAAASGSLFACPNCRNKETFRRHAADQGVHLFEGLPDYVKTGAVNANDRFCCAEHCQSPYGPTYDTTSNRPTRRGAHEQSRWQLLSCLSCGSKSVHIGCSGRSLNVDLTRWRCDDCGGAPTLPAVVPQFETQEAVRPQTLTGRPPKRRRKPRDDRVGRWVEVYWAGDGEWYRGRVKSQRTRSGRLVFKIAYADGETIAHALQDEACAGDVPPLLPDGAPEPWRFVDAEPPEPQSLLVRLAAGPTPVAAEASTAAEAATAAEAEAVIAADEAAAAPVAVDTAAPFAVGALVAEADAPQHALEVVAVEGAICTLRYRDAGAWRGQEVARARRRLVAFGAALPGRRLARLAPFAARPLEIEAPLGQAPVGAEPEPFSGPPLGQAPEAPVEDVLAAAPTSYDDAAAIRAQAEEAQDVFGAVLDDDDDIQDVFAADLDDDGDVDDAPLEALDDDAADHLLEDPFELGAARMAAAEAPAQPQSQASDDMLGGYDDDFFSVGVEAPPRHALDGFEIGTGLLIDDAAADAAEAADQRPGANVRRTVLTGAAARRAEAELRQSRRPRRECSASTAAARPSIGKGPRYVDEGLRDVVEDEDDDDEEDEDEDEEPVVAKPVRRRHKPGVDPLTAWAARATLPLWVVWCRCGLKACNANSREEEMWQCDRCHCWRHARCCRGEKPGDCGCGRGDAARRVALAAPSSRASEDRPLADALVIRQRLAAVCAISERSPGLLPAHVTQAFGKCWQGADGLAKTILSGSGALEASQVLALINVRRAADVLRQALAQARRVVRGDAGAVRAVAAAARKLPSPEDRASFNEHARALFDRLGSVEARLKRLVGTKPVVEAADDEKVVASFDFAHTSGSVRDSDRWCPAVHSRAIGANATLTRPGRRTRVVVRARRDGQLQWGRPPRIVARGFGEASVDVVAVDAFGKVRAACGLAPVAVGVLACTRLVEAEDDVLLDVVLPATHRLARQLGARVVAAAQGVWDENLPFSPAPPGKRAFAPKGTTALALDDLDADESEDESDESEDEEPVAPHPRRRRDEEEPVPRQSPNKKSAPAVRRGAFPSAWDTPVARKQPPAAKRIVPPLVPVKRMTAEVVRVARGGAVARRRGGEDEGQRTQWRYLLLAALGGSQHASATKIATALESQVWTACESGLRGPCVEHLAEVLAKKRTARDALLRGAVAPAAAVAEAKRRAAKRKPVTAAPAAPAPAKRRPPPPAAPLPMRVEQRVAAAAARPLPCLSSASATVQAKPRVQPSASATVQARAPNAWAALTVGAPAATPSPPAPSPPQPPAQPTEASFARKMRRAVASFLGRHLERGRINEDAMARLAPKLAKALVAKHASRSADFSFTDKVRSKVRKYVDEYVERKGGELR